MFFISFDRGVEGCWGWNCFYFGREGGEFHELIGIDHLMDLVSSVSLIELFFYEYSWNYMTLLLAFVGSVFVVLCCLLLLF